MKPALQRLCLNGKEPLSRGLQVLQETQAGICIAITEDGRIIGTVTDGDCRRALLSGHTLESPISAIAHTNFIAVDESFPVEQAYSLMKTNSVYQIPVVDDQNRIIDLIFEKCAPAITNQADVIILAGGKGRRMMPLTEHVPKPMLQVGGKPILARLVESLVDGGFGEICISISYLASQIEDYFGDGTKWGCKISYVREEIELGTAGPIKLLKQTTQRAVLVVNGDLVTRVNFSALVDFHQNSEFDFTIGSSNYGVQVPYGVLSLNSGGKLLSVTEKPSYSFPVSAGIYVINPAVLQLIPDNTHFSMTDLITAAVGQGISVGAFPIHERWLDVGLPEQYSSAQRES